MNNIGNCSGYILPCTIQKMISKKNMFLFTSKSDKILFFFFLTGFSILPVSFQVVSMRLDGANI